MQTTSVKMLQSELNSFILETYIPGKDSFPHPAAMFGYHGDSPGQHQKGHRRVLEAVVWWSESSHLQVSQCGRLWQSEMSRLLLQLRERNVLFWGTVHLTSAWNRPN